MIKYFNTLTTVVFFKKYIILPFVVTNKLSLKFKLGHILLTSFLLSPLAWFSDLLKNHVILSQSFVKVLVILLFVDMVAGMMKHWKLHTFDWGELFKGLVVKVAISFMGMAVFNALASMEEFGAYPSLRDYVILVGKLCNFLYVGGSAFNNMYIVTDGKFPPAVWMKRFKKFSTTLDLKDLKQAEPNPSESGELLEDILKEEQDKVPTNTQVIKTE